MHVPSSASVSPSMIGDTQLRSFKNAPAACRHNISLSKIDGFPPPWRRRALPNLSTNLRDKAFHCDWQIKMTSFPRGNISRPARNFRILDFSQFIKNSRIFRESLPSNNKRKKESWVSGWAHIQWDVIEAGLLDIWAPVVYLYILQYDDVNHGQKTAFPQLFCTPLREMEILLQGVCRLLSKHQPSPSLSPHHLTQPCSIKWELPWLSHS